MRFSLLPILLLAPFLSLSPAAPTRPTAGESTVIGDLFGVDPVFEPTRTRSEPLQKRILGGPSASPSHSPRPSTSSRSTPSASASARYHPRAFVPLPTTLPLGSWDDLARCPMGDLACPISPRLGGGEAWDEDYECITPAEDLYSCGGCLTLGTGYDCTSIPNTLSVSCASSRCIVHSCQPGYTPSGDSCVPSLSILAR